MTDRLLFLSLLLALGLKAPLWAQQPADELPATNTMSEILFPHKAPAPWSVGLYYGTDNNEHVVDMSYATSMIYSGLGGKTAGLTAAYWLWGWLSFRADLALVQKNYLMHRENTNITFCRTETTNNYLSLPMTAHISFGRTAKLYAFGGMYAGYWLSSHRSGRTLSFTWLLNQDNGSTYFDEDYLFDSRRDNRFDGGWLYGGGFRITLFSTVELFAEMRWYYGLTDEQKNYMSNLNPRYNTTRAILFGASYWLKFNTGNND